MTTKFFVPKRYDSKTAIEGQWFRIDDESDNHYGEFKLRFLDTSGKTYENAIKRARLKYAGQLRQKKLDAYDLSKVVLCELHLLDWKLPTDPEDKKAKPIEFSLENALEYFGMTEITEAGDEIRPTQWILEKLSELASQASNFSGLSEEPTVEEVVGN